MLWDMAQQLLGGNGNANAKESPGAAVDDESKGVLDSVMGAVDGAQKIAGMIPGGNTVAGPLLKSLGVGLKIGSFIDDKLKISDNLAGVTPEKLDEHYRGVGGVERQKTRGAAGIADAEEAQKRKGGFGAVKTVRQPLPMCKAEVATCYEHRADELGCVNPEFFELPRGKPSFRVVEQQPSDPA